MAPQNSMDDYSPGQTLVNIVSEGSRNKIVFLTFITQTCPGCKETYAALHKFSKKHEGLVEIVVVDADRHPPLIIHYGVSGVPTLYIYGRQEHLFTEVGPHSVRMLNKLLKRAQSILAT